MLCVCVFWLTETTVASVEHWSEPAEYLTSLIFISELILI